MEIDLVMEVFALEGAMLILFFFLLRFSTMITQTTITASTSTPATAIIATARFDMSQVFAMQSSVSEVHVFSLNEQHCVAHS